MRKRGLLWRSERGDVTILIVTFSLFCILLATVGLDIFTILYARRAAQTTADTAAFGAMRAAMPVLSKYMWERTTKKILDLFDQAQEEYDQKLQSWEASRDAAADACKTDADPTQCESDWMTANPAPDLKEIEQQTLEQNVPDPMVVDALMGGPSIPTDQQVVQAVLTPQDRWCVMERNSTQLEATGEIEAKKYAHLNGGEISKVEFPYEDTTLLMVEVTRDIPTMLLGRVTGKSLTARRLATVTLFTGQVLAVPGNCP